MKLRRAVPRGPRVGAALFCIVLLSTALPALAQIDGPHAELSAGAGLALFEQWLGIDDGLALVGRGGYHPQSWWGLEATFEHLSSDNTKIPGASSSFTNYSLGFTAHTTPTSRLTPYFHLGLGYGTLDIESDAASSITVGLAGGAKYRVNRDFGIRVEVKDILAHQFDSTTHTVFLTLGVSLTRGQDADDDGDGISNLRDRCPGTPRGATVDAGGCPSDEDGDGVPTGLDDCPDTPRGVRVDERGCPRRNGPS